MKLALGTAQFGLDYGIANGDGKISSQEAQKIISTAREMGIDTLDTAVAYGDSEGFLGNLNVQDFKIITKLSAPPSVDRRLGIYIKSGIHASLARLQTDNLYSLLLHRSDIVNEENAEDIQTSVNNLKRAGALNKFGVSIYDPQELDRITALVDIDIVQAPFNLLDRRLETSGWLQKLYDRGIEVHVRSVFLQGLLLMPPEILPAQFSRWKTIFLQMSEWTKKYRINQLGVCLAAVADCRVSRTVIGVDSADHLNQIGKILKTSEKIPFPDLMCNDLNLINPSNWKNQ